MLAESRLLPSSHWNLEIHAVRAIGLLRCSHVDLVQWNPLVVLAIQIGQGIAAFSMM